MLRPWILQIEIDKSSTKALYLQLADNIIQLIVKGSLRKGDVLPGSRVLSQQLGVSRKTIISATDILVIEGWVTSQDRKGLFISNELPSKLGRGKTVDEKQLAKEIHAATITIFDDGLPNTAIAPMDELARAYRQVFKQKAKWQMMGYGDELGTYKFREAIASMLNHKRGLHTQPAQICITRGSQMALYLIANTLLQRGDIVLVENPGYKPAWDTFAHMGATLMPIDVDSQGIRVDQVEQILEKKKVRAIYITPHHQYPTTVSLTLERRLRLAELANKHNILLIEDDYDNEFHFGQRPIMPISTLVKSQNAVYISSLSKMVAPSIRIGYLVTCVETIEKIGKLRRIIDVQGDNIMEQAVLELINTGDIRRHINRASKHYKAKRDLFAKLIEKHLANKVSYKTPEGGLAFWITFNTKQDFKKLNKQLMANGIQITTPDKYSFHEPVNGLRLGYASLTEEQLEQATILLAQAIE